MKSGLRPGFFMSDEGGPASPLPRRDADGGWAEVTYQCRRRFLAGHGAVLGLADHKAANADVFLA